MKEFRPMRLDEVGVQLCLVERWVVCYSLQELQVGWQAAHLVTISEFANSC